MSRGAMCLIPGALFLAYWFTAGTKQDRAITGIVF
jgi:hypothetical protein